MNIKNISLTVFLSILTFTISYMSLKTYNNSILLNNEFKSQSEINYIDNKLNEKYKATKELLSKETEEIVKSTSKLFTQKLNEWSNKYIGEDILKENKTEEKKELLKIQISSENKEKLNKNVYKTFYIYLSVVFIMLLLLLVSLKLKIINTNIVLFFILITSVVSLIVGVLSPIITMEIFKELPILGYTVLKYETKSIFGTILKLIDNHNVVIAILISFFSIIVPLIKTSIMFISLFSYKSIHFIDKIGKWSMADVFVVSIFISILSLNTDKFTNAEVQIGVYFFTIYVILSIISSYILTNRENHESKKISIKLT